MDNRKFKLITLYLFLGWISFFGSVHAQYDIFLRNDTSHTLYIDTQAPDNLPESSHHGWHNRALHPYQADKIQVFNYDKHIKNRHRYTFKIYIKRHPDDKKALLTFTTKLKGKRIGSQLYRSELNTRKSAIYLFNKKPQAMNALVFSQKIDDIFDSHKQMTVYATAIKYSIPNPHYNFQSTDALVYTLSEPQKQYAYSYNPYELTLATYNVQLWPFYAPIGGIRMNQPKERSKQISKRMAAYDLVSFQETMDRALRISLKQNMLQHYPFQYGPAMGKALLSSGLMIFSRWPIERASEMIYQACNAIDCNADKGVLYVKINKQGQHYHIFNTHMQADGNKNYQGNIKVRAAQIKELKQFIKAQSIPDNEAILLMGDLNINGSQCIHSQAKHCEEFKQLIAELDANYSVHRNHKTLAFSSDPSKNWMNTRDTAFLLDYILALHNKKNIVQYESRLLVLRGNDTENMYLGSPYANTDLSDHFALEAKVLYPRE